MAIRPSPFAFNPPITYRPISNDLSPNHPSPNLQSEHPCRRDWPPPDLYFADDVPLRHESPMAAVRAVIAVIAHHEVIPLGYHLRSPVVVRPIFVGNEVITHRRFVHVDVAVDDANGIAFFGDHALDERFV